MARFLVKASEFKNVCKAVNDRKLAELKKEIIEILKKQDEKEVKKAIDYFNSQELHYTHLEKSLNGKWIEKAGYGVGTVRIWKGKKYKKIAPGKWARVFEKEGRGTNVAVGRLIAQIGKIDNIEDLEKFVAANKQRFVDENGKDLPVVEKIKAAADSRNGNVESKEKTVEDKIKENPDYPFKPKTDKERAERDAFEKDRDDFIERMDKIRQENKKKDSESAEKKEVDYSKMSEDELNELNKKLRQTIKEKDYGEADEEIEQINKISKQKIINSYKTREKHTLQHVDGVEQKKKMIADSKAIVEKDLARKEKQRVKESSIAKKNQMADEINELKYMKAAFEQLENEVNSESQNSDSDIERAKDKIKQYAGKKINSNEISDIKILDDGKRSGFLTFEFKSGNDKYKMTYDSGFGGEKGGVSINKIESEESEAEKTQNRSENARHFGTDWEESRKEIQSKLVENTDKMFEGYDKAKDVYEKLQSNLDKRKVDAELYRKYLGNQEEPEDVKDFRKWCDDVIEQYKKEVTYTPSKEIISKWEETAKNTPTEKLEEVYNGKQKVDYSNEYENYIDSTIINTFAKDKDLVFPQPYTMLKDIATRKFDNSDKIRLEVIKKELESRKKGKNVEKSLFDDLFEIDIIAADELEDEEELKENETEYNDYTAEQPDLFNSPEFAVREALNRRFNCR